jgi:hypothetical protein
MTRTLDFSMLSINGSSLDVSEDVVRTQILARQTPELAGSAGSDGVSVDPVVGGSQIIIVDSLAGFEVLSPFYLEVCHQLEDVSVRHGDTEVFGVGDDLSEAVEDFRESIAELYTRLDSERASLGIAMQGVLHLLDSKIRRL